MKHKYMDLKCDLVSPCYTGEFKACTVNHFKGSDLSYLKSEQKAVFIPVTLFCTSHKTQCDYTEMHFTMP